MAVPRALRRIILGPVAVTGALAVLAVTAALPAIVTGPSLFTGSALFAGSPIGGEGWVLPWLLLGLTAGYALSGST